MKILGIETSCDETGVCLIEAHSTGSGQANKNQVTVLGNQLYSQIALHEKYGGVFPMMAKREHAKNLVPLLEKCLEEASLLFLSSDEEGLGAVEEKIKNILIREGELFEDLKKFLKKTKKPDIDAIAVTNGPGLEPALWVGVTFAKALGVAWNIPIIPTNHMEGHIVASLLFPNNACEALPSIPRLSQGGVASRRAGAVCSGLEAVEYKINKIKYPAVALLISGGHTQLVLIKDKLKYEIIGSTKDDAVGEAFDKVARMLGLPYPGGPQIAKYANDWKNKKSARQTFKFPRPMISSKDLNFSFSGLKTSVLYSLKKFPVLTEEIKQEVAYEFKKAVIDVLVTKTKSAILEFGASSLIVGGGVIADRDIRQALEKMSAELNIDFYLPEISASTDNALMIAVAGFLRSQILGVRCQAKEFKAEGNLSL